MSSALKRDSVLLLPHERIFDIKAERASPLNLSTVNLSAE